MYVVNNNANELLIVTSKVKIKLTEIKNKVHEVGVENVHLRKKENPLGQTPLPIGKTYTSRFLQHANKPTH